jgi:alpha-glucosidase
VAGAGGHGRVHRRPCPWLPLGEENLARAVDRQEADPASLLSLTTRLLHLRRETPALRHGSFDVLQADASLLVARRRFGGQSLLVLINMSNQPVAWPQDVAQEGTVLVAENDASLGYLPGFAALIVEERI